MFCIIDILIYTKEQKNISLPWKTPLMYMQTRFSKMQLFFK